MSSNSKPQALTEVDKDLGSEVFLSGKHQQVPVDPAGEFARTTLAAGAVLWRGNPESPEVALIHRPRYNDWSLPKGKVDPGESLVTTAAREISEETGFEVRLGKLLGKVTYPVQNRTKVVYYWEAEVTGGEFNDNDEVDELRWMPLAKAAKKVSYALDADVLHKAAKRLQLQPTTRVLYVRHARAHKRSSWSGDDNLRPLDKKGRRQAEMLVPLLSAYGPTAIYSAVPDRCQQTAAPLADELNFDVHVDHFLGDDGWQEDPQQARQSFQEIVDRGGVPVIVGQGLVIPEIIAGLEAKFLDEDADDLPVKKSSVWVLSFNNGELTGADYLASPLPVR